MNSNNSGWNLGCGYLIKVRHPESPQAQSRQPTALPSEHNPQLTCIQYATHSALCLLVAIGSNNSMWLKRAITAAARTQAEMTAQMAATLY
jgi:hypothetical protein